MSRLIMTLYGLLVLAVVSVLCVAPVSAASSKVVAIDAGGHLSLALKDDGTVMAWGTMMGFLPNRGKPFFQSSTPVVVNITDVSAVSAGNFFVLFLKNDGTVWGWGDNEFGELGDGTNEETSLEPVQVAGLHDIIAISTSGTHCLALRRDGTVWAWGWNVAGQLGIGTTSEGEYTPVQVPGLSDIKIISAGYQCSMAIDKDGRLWAWGSNGRGKLGDGTTITRLYPIQVPIDDVIDVAASEGAHTLALKKDGTVWAWGWNQENELGFVSGSSVNSVKECHTPVMVKGVDSVVSVSTTDSNSIALRSDGTVWIWGNGQQGRLGNGALYGADSATPQQVPGLENVVAIAGGSAHIMAMTGDGSVYAWGDNQGGQIGNGEFLSYTGAVTRPTLVIRGDGTTTTTLPSTPATSSLPESSQSPQNTSASSRINYLGVAGILGIILVIGLIIYIIVKNKK
ncbi:Alpha-tubulin suppressor and related RCC1 domain-containing protein [Methanocella conradii HZ254]|uniref:Alpha-tubulin suppressor and related RCC1 domain-containing protein n=1 Tax=Methanocella conradii (strain DSM 24694 / JCM 17849 / CGMCC 1.5162 / HZ254) TaxID=1041930 RepID=H8I8M5_METCZ|nr:alpha-tubulin suppressor [Methanocella conradii]AFC99501.1 Alpha-tubulin suppressor and related RCC1 domain-containing protein [Methanocella conradii HZ254]